MNPRAKALVILGSGLLAAVVVVALFASAGSGTRKSKYASIRFEAEVHDLGTLRAGEERETTFRFENAGLDSLRIRRVVGSCACTASLFTPTAYGPGERGEIRVIYDSRGKHGPQVESVTVLSNDPEQPMVQLKIHAEVQKGTL